MEYIIYKNSKGKEKAEIIQEDSTHILIRFKSGAKIATSKSLHTIYEDSQYKLF